MKTILILLLLLFKIAIAQELPIELILNVDSAYSRTLDSSEIKFLNRELGTQIIADTLQTDLYTVTLTITNRSDKPVNFWLMTCSYEENFLINNNYIFIHQHECDGNFPTLIVLDQKQKVEYSFIHEKSVNLKNPSENCIAGSVVKDTKLGLILIDNIYENNLEIPGQYMLAMEDKNRWTIVWSNAIRPVDKEE